MNDVNLEPINAMRQASMTADHYLAEACKILESYDKVWSIGDAIELSKVMAQDFHSAMMCIKMQEIRDAIYEVSSS